MLDSVTLLVLLAFLVAAAARFGWEVAGAIAGILAGWWERGWGKPLGGPGR